MSIKWISQDSALIINFNFSMCCIPKNGMQPTSVCKISMDMMKLTEKDLNCDAKVFGAIEFIGMEEGAQILFM